MKLKDICSFQSGGTPSKSTFAYYNGTIPWITTVSLNGNTINENDAVEWITEQAITESAAKIVPENSIMVGTRVGIGKTAINTIPMSTNQDIISLIGINESEWDKGYINKWIQSKRSFLNSQARGATIKGIKIDVLANLSVPVLPISKQQEIVKILDHVQNLIARRRYELRCLDDFIKARFVEMFGTVSNNQYGFEVKPLSEVASEFFAGGDKPSDCSSIQDEDHPYPVYANGFENSGLQGYSSVCRVRNSAVTVSARGTIGYCFVRDAGFTPVVRLITIVPKSEVSVEYLKYAINAMAIKTSGTSQAQLTVPEFKKELIVVPPTSQQQAFSCFVKQIDKSKFVVQQALEKAQLLLDSLMQKYFG